VLEAAPAEKRADALEETSRFMRMLGKRLGEMHVALAQPSDEPAFAPESAGAGHCKAWAAEVSARIDEALDLLAARKDWAHEDDAKLAAQLAGQRKHLKALAAQWAARGEGSVRTRIHGDLHLGQVLVAQDDVYIIDFEGEPARPLAERREKGSPLRDVAGMLRSFDYAAATAMGVGGAGQSGTDRARKAEIVAKFRDTSGQAFLTAYREAAKPIAHQWQDRSAESALLDLFVLQKAAYEVAYEASNRPAWLGVPMRGLAAFASKALTGDSHG